MKTVHGSPIRQAQAQQFTVHSFKRGFTLLEFTVVVGLLMLAIGSTLAILLNTLKGSNQANVTTEVKQNGQAILDTLERQIRNATQVECKATPLNPPSTLPVACDDPTASTKYIKIIRQSENPLHVKCFDTVSTTPSSNGWVGTVVSADEDPINSAYTYVSSYDPVSGVDVSTCSLDVLPATSGGVSPTIVVIDLTIRQGIQAPSRQDFIADSQFRTTISLRRY